MAQGSEGPASSSARATRKAEGARHAPDAVPSRALAPHSGADAQVTNNRGTKIMIVIKYHNLVNL